MKRQLFIYIISRPITSYLTTKKEAKHNLTSMTRKVTFAEAPIKRSSDRQTGKQQTLAYLSLTSTYIPVPILSAIEMCFTSIFRKLR